MTSPDGGPTAWRAAYSIHPLSALDGVLLYVCRNGETVGFYFGASERLAAASLAHSLPVASEGRAA